MMSAELTTPDLLNMKLFWNKDYEVIISAHDVANKIFSRDSNYIDYNVDVGKWPKFGNSSISMKATSIF